MKLKKALENRKTSHVHRLAKLLFKSDLQLQCNYPQCYNDILHKRRKKSCKIHLGTKRPQIAKAVLNKNSNAVSIAIPDFMLYSTGIVTENHDTHTKSDM
jgi:hypothetical protein